MAVNAEAVVAVTADAGAEAVVAVTADAKGFGC